MPEVGAVLGLVGVVVTHERIPSRGPARFQLPTYVLRKGWLCPHPEAFYVHRLVLETSREAAVVFDRALQGLSREELWVLSMDEACRAVGLARAAVGDSEGISVDAGRVVGIARRLGQRAFLVAHNHPTGDPSPSTFDWIATRQLLDAAREADLELVDHLVLGDGVYASLRGRNESMFAEPGEVFP